jgi:polysaccharide export outer membrane protein
MKKTPLLYNIKSIFMITPLQDWFQFQWIGRIVGFFRAIKFGAASLVFLLGLGCQSPAPLPSDTRAPRPVTLSAGDVVKMTFSGAPELNQSQKIRTDGKLTLPQVGEVNAAGKTLLQFQNELATLYRPKLRDSDVLVTLESSVTQVYITGAVNRPGKLSFDRPTTILQAIAEAGGATEFGSLKKVRVVRLENGEQRVEIVDLRSSTGGAFYVRNGDIITIPQSAF